MTQFTTVLYADRMTNDTILWLVYINNSQATYVVESDSAGDAAVEAGEVWRNDHRRSAKQLNRGIYDIRVQPAKFGHVKDFGVANR